MVLFSGYTGYIIMRATRLIHMFDMAESLRIVHL